LHDIECDYFEEDIMRKLILISLLLLAFSSIFVVLNANQIQNEFNLDVYPNPMETTATISAIFTDKIPITVTMIDSDDLMVKTIYEGISTKGQMLIPFDRIDNKGDFIPKGKYWVVLSTNAKYTSTKKLLILK
jgi:hypothetical protein